MMGCINPILGKINTAIFVHILPQIGLKQPSIVKGTKCKGTDYSKPLHLGLRLKIQTRRSALE